jgi:hypothetical protein
MDVWHGIISESVWAQEVRVQRTRYGGVGSSWRIHGKDRTQEIKHHLMLLCYLGCSLLLTKHVSKRIKSFDRSFFMKWEQ